MNSADDYPAEANLPAPRLPGEQAIHYHSEDTAVSFDLCGSADQTAGAGRTLRDRGYENSKTIGGIGAWTEAGGPMQS